MVENHKTVEPVRESFFSLFDNNKRWQINYSNANAVLCRPLLFYLLANTCLERCAVVVQSLTKREKGVKRCRPCAVVPLFGPVPKKFEYIELRQVNPEKQHKRHEFLFLSLSFFSENNCTVTPIQSGASLSCDKCISATKQQKILKKIGSRAHFPAQHL